MSDIYAGDLTYYLGDLLEQASEHPDLTEWEHGFVASMCERYAKWGSETMISDRQEAVLERIRKKVG
jgi:hypothetical protein